MSAVQRGKATGKKPLMEKALKEVCSIACVMEITEPDDLAIDAVVEKISKVSVLDGSLVVPSPQEKAVTSREEKADTPQEPSVDMIEEVYEPGTPAAPDSTEPEK